MELAESVRRFQRVVKIGNPVTIKLATRDLINDVPKLKPIDLVNAFKTAGKSGNERLLTVIQAECKKRNFKSFNGKDLAFLLSAADKTSPDLVSVIERKFTPEFTRTMRTTDLCVSLLAFARSNSKTVPALISMFLNKFLKGERVKQFNEMNIIQVLSALSVKQSLEALERIEPEQALIFTEQLLRKIEKECSSFSDESIAFSLFAIVQVFQAIRIPLDHSGRLNYLNLMAGEVARRDTLTDMQLVTCVRALGRARALNKNFVERRLMPKLKDLQLNKDQQSGLNAALLSGAKMTALRTNAIPDDFPHLLAWFGKTPSFEFVKDKKKFHCRDEWFKFRQLVDMRYYANFVYTEHENYNLQTIMKRIEDISVCRKIKKMGDDEERRTAYQHWFEKRRNVINDVWEYKVPPRVLRGN